MDLKSTSDKEPQSQDSYTKQQSFYHDKISVLVAGFPKEHDSEAIRVFIESISPSKHYKQIKKNINQFKGLVFVYFETKEEAEDFCSKEYRYQGKLVDCKISKNQEDFINESLRNLRFPNKIFAINIPSYFSKTDTGKVFGKYGEIQEIVLVDKEIKKSKIAYVSFKNFESAKKCVKNHKVTIMPGCTVTIEYARPKFTRTMQYKIHPVLRAYIRQIQKGEKPYDPIEFCEFHDQLLSDSGINTTNAINKLPMQDPVISEQPQINLNYMNAHGNQNDYSNYEHDLTPQNYNQNLGYRNDFQNFAYAAQIKMDDSNLHNNWHEPVNYTNNGDQYTQEAYQNYNLNPSYSYNSMYNGSEYNVSDINSSISNQFDGYYYRPRNDSNFESQHNSDISFSSHKEVGNKSYGKINETEDMTEKTNTDINSKIKHLQKSKSYVFESENQQDLQNNDDSLLKRGNTAFCEPNGVTSTYENNADNNNLAYGDQTQKSQSNNMHSYETQYNNDTNQSYSEYYKQNDGNQWDNSYNNPNAEHLYYGNNTNYQGHDYQQPNNGNHQQYYDQSYYNTSQNADEYKNHQDPQIYNHGYAPNNYDNGYVNSHQDQYNYQGYTSDQQNGNQIVERCENFSNKDRCPKVDDAIQNKSD